MCHHTAGPLTGIMPSLGVVTNGRPDLAGPLAQLCLGRDGTYFVVAAGRANHAGAGDWQGITSGNTNFIGIEAEITGKQPVPRPTSGRGAIGRVSPRRGRHPETHRRRSDHVLRTQGVRAAGRKKDRSDFDMVEFRRQVAAIMGGTAPPPTVIPRLTIPGVPRCAAARPVIW